MAIARRSFSYGFNPELLNETQTCPAVGYQSASICVPVTVTPFAQTGMTTTKCCGNPVVTPGREVCGGVKNGSCFFTITQDICVAFCGVWRGCHRGRELCQLQRGLGAGYLHRLRQGSRSARAGEAGGIIRFLPCGGGF